MKEMTEAGEEVKKEGRERRGMQGEEEKEEESWALLRR